MLYVINWLIESKWPSFNVDTLRGTHCIYTNKKICLSKINLKKILNPKFRSSAN